MKFFSSVKSFSIREKNIDKQWHGKKAKNIFFFSLHLRGTFIFLHYIQRQHRKLFKKKNLNQKQKKLVDILEIKKIKQWKMRQVFAHVWIFVINFCIENWNCFSILLTTKYDDYFIVDICALYILFHFHILYFIIFFVGFLFYYYYY